MKIISPEKACEYAKVNFPIFPDDWYISPHFKWNEVFVNEIRAYGVPPLEIFKNAVKASVEFEKVRVFLGKAMNIHCWYRSSLHNLSLVKQGYKPAMHSSHLYALAIDYHVIGMTPFQVRAKLVEGIKIEKFKIRIESNTLSWIHNDIGNPYIGDYRWGVFNP